LTLGLVSSGSAVLAQAQTPPTSLPSRFKLINQKDDNRYFLDATSVRRQRTLANFRIVVLSKSNPALPATLIDYAANCQNRRYQTLRTYTVQNNQPVQISGIEGVEQAQKNTLANDMLSKACAAR
jgi:hypothetical protein